MHALTPDLELRLRTELAERRVAELTAALENMKGERDSVANNRGVQIVARAAN